MKSLLDRTTTSGRANAISEGLVPHFAFKALVPKRGQPVGGSYPPVKSARLQRLREEREMTATEVAKLLGVRFEVITNTEAGTHNPHPLVSFALARIYGVRLKEILA